MNNLPKGDDGPGYVHVIREDIANRDLLFVGTDVGLYVSLNRGASWQRFMTGFPTVPVHDLRIHPRDRDLLAATHGRALWIVNIAPLEQLNDSAIAATAYLFQPTTAYQYGQPPLGGGSAGQKAFRAPSPPYGADIVYRLATGSSDRRARTSIVIRDVRGDTVRTVQGPAGPGLHRVTWNFQGRTPPPVALSPSQKRDSAWLVQRINVVFDSLAKNGGNAQQLEPIKSLLLTGDVQGLRSALDLGEEAEVVGVVAVVAAAAAVGTRSTPKVGSTSAPAKRHPAQLPRRAPCRPPGARAAASQGTHRPTRPSSRRSAICCASPARAAAGGAGAVALARWRSSPRHSDVRLPAVEGLEGLAVVRTQSRQATIWSLLQWTGRR